MLCLWTDCVNIKHILLGIPSFVNQTKFRSNRFLFFVLFCFFFIKIVQNSIMFCLDVPTMSNTCAIVFLVCHMCAYLLIFFSFWKYMYVFLQNKPLLYIPLYLHMIKILHVISVISCSFNTFSITFGTDVLLSLVLRTCNTFHPLYYTCKILFDLFCVFHTLNIVFILKLKCPNNLKMYASSLWMFSFQVTSSSSSFILKK